jgi:phosphoglycerol transferase MdoB-like AlkP superfamily enzyme
MFEIETYKNLTIAGVATCIAAGIIFSTILIGSLYSIQQWDGGTHILILGLICLAILLILNFIVNRNRSTIFYYAVLKRGIVLGAFALLCLSVARF